MAKRTESTKSERLRRSDPERDAPNRSGSDHIRRHATSRNGNGGNDRSESSRVSETLQRAISDMVELSSNVIEDQIRAGQTAAERLRDGIARWADVSCQTSRNRASRSGVPISYSALAVTNP